MGKTKIKAVRTIITKHSLRTICNDQGYCTLADNQQYQQIFDKLESYETIDIDALQELAEMIVAVTDFSERGLPFEATKDHVCEVMSNLSLMTFTLFEY